MIHIVIFYIVQVAICWFALRAGGTPERVVAAGLLIAAAGTSAAAVATPHEFRAIDTVFLMVDVALLALLGGVAAAANRFWPIWIAALHLLGVAVHGVKAYDPDLVPWIYALAIGKIAYPMLALLAIGTERHRRRRAEYGDDPDWSLGRYQS